MTDQPKPGSAFDSFVSGIDAQLLTQKVKDELKELEIDCDDHVMQAFQHEEGWTQEEAESERADFIMRAITQTDDYPDLAIIALSRADAVPVVPQAHHSSKGGVLL